MSDTPDQDRCRLDKWLWAARFFKTRALAVEAINGGKVHVNGARAKPARSARVGDELRITKGIYEYAIHVRALSDRRGPATVAAELYEETPESVLTRTQRASEQRLHTPIGPHPSRRPSKRDRRQIIRFKSDQG